MTTSKQWRDNKQGISLTTSAKGYTAPTANCLPQIRDTKHSKTVKLVF